MPPRRNRRLFRRMATAGLLGWAAFLPVACQSPPPAAESPTGPFTLLEEQLLGVLAEQERLDTLAAREDADPREVQRRFQAVAQQFAAIIARNPDHLESRLLYGKLLSRYGDREGARDQFLAAARIDPNRAVIHQELSTFFAEEGDFTRALAYALNAVSLEPQTAAYHYQLGQILAAFREPLLAAEVLPPQQLDADLLRAFATAKNLQPDAIALQFRYGEAFYDVAEPDWHAALAHWQALLPHPALSPIQQDAVRLHLVRCLVETGQPEAAAALLPAIITPAFRQSAHALLNPP